MRLIPAGGGNEERLPQLRLNWSTSKVDIIVSTSSEGLLAVAASNQEYPYRLNHYWMGRREPQPPLRECNGVVVYALESWAANDWNSLKR